MLKGITERIEKIKFDLENINNIKTSISNSRDTSIQLVDRFKIELGNFYKKIRYSISKEIDGGNFLFNHENFEDNIPDPFQEAKLDKFYNEFKKLLTLHLKNIDDGNEELQWSFIQFAGGVLGTIGTGVGTGVAVATTAPLGAALMAGGVGGLATVTVAGNTTGYYRTFCALLEKKNENKNLDKAFVSASITPIIIKLISMEITIKYNRQIKNLENSGINNLAKHALLRIVNMFKHEIINSTETTDIQEFSKNVVRKLCQISHPQYRDWSNISIDSVNRNSFWTESGVFEKTSILVSGSSRIYTKDGLTEHDKYGSRIGTQKEVNELEFKLIDNTTTPAIQEYLLEEQGQEIQFI